MRENIEKNAWDGEWYRRAYFDNGGPLGSASDPKRTRIAMAAVAQRRVRRDKGLIQLFDPPFDKSSLEPGYIKGYVPGVRENGGQYTHGAIWTVMAFAAMGDVNTAWELFNLINPVRHADTPAAMARYKVEPYAGAADVYSVTPHTGRGRWTWYSGSAAWLYRLITETLPGLQLEVDKLRFAPRLPTDWKFFKLHYRYRETSCHISLFNDSGTWLGKQRFILDDVELSDVNLPLKDDHAEHNAEVHFVSAAALCASPQKN